MSNTHPDHGWTPTHRTNQRAGPAPEQLAALEAKWTRVSANVFVSAVLSGARGPLVKAHRSAGSSEPAVKISWWRKLINAAKTA